MTFSTVLQLAVSEKVLFLDILVNAVISTFLIAVEMRILGLLYLSYKDRLDLF